MNQYITKAKEFFRSIGKLTASLFLATLGVVFVIYAYSTISDAYQKKKNEKYETVVDWSNDLKVIGLTAKAKTKVVNGSMYVQLDFEGHPDYLKHPSLVQKNRDTEFILKFIDDDKFDLFERRIKINQFTTRVNESGKPAGLLYQFTDRIDTSTYEKFRTLNIGWTFDTAIPEAVQQAVRTPKSDKPSSSDSTDHCAPGLSRSERLRRLALFSTLRESAKDSYSAGSKSVMFLYDGSVLYCN
jgi:hypothetical protein